jgi:hypothetical protein
MADSPAKQINFTIVPDDPGSESPDGKTGKPVRAYANFCAIAHSPFDLTITFCDVQPLTADDIRHAEATETVRAPIVARIAVPFAVVPGIINALTEHMRAMQASSAEAPGSSPTSPSWPGPDKGPLH